MPQSTLASQVADSENSFSSVDLLLWPYCDYLFRTHRLGERVASGRHRRHRRFDDATRFAAGKEARNKKVKQSKESKAKPKKTRKSAKKEEPVPTEDSPRGKDAQGPDAGSGEVTDTDLFVALETKRRKKESKTKNKAKKRGKPHKKKKAKIEGTGAEPEADIDANPPEIYDESQPPDDDEAPPPQATKGRKDKQKDKLKDEVGSPTITDVPKFANYMACCRFGYFYRYAGKPIELGKLKIYPNLVLLAVVGVSMMLNVVLGSAVKAIYWKDSFSRRLSGHSEWKGTFAEGTDAAGILVSLIVCHDLLIVLLVGRLMRGSLLYLGLVVRLLVVFALSIGIPLANAHTVALHLIGALNMIFSVMVIVVIYWSLWPTIM